MPHRRMKIIYCFFWRLRVTQSL